MDNNLVAVASVQCFGAMLDFETVGSAAESGFSTGSLEGAIDAVERLSGVAPTILSA